ncbi:hypothetical protein Tco_1555486 [Tanacetum coccineum]
MGRKHQVNTSKETLYRVSLFRLRDSVDKAWECFRVRRREERSLNNNSFLGEYECSSLALDRDERRDEKKRLDHFETRSNNVSDQEISGCEGLGGASITFQEKDWMVEERVDYVSLVDEVFDGAFGGEGEEDVVIGEGVVVTSSSLEMLTNSCLGGIMVSLIFLEGLEEEA